MVDKVDMVPALLTTLVEDKFKTLFILCTRPPSTLPLDSAIQHNSVGFTIIIRPYCLKWHSAPELFDILPPS